MSGRSALELHEVLVISCDIVGHSSESNHDVQFDRVAGVNAVVAETIGKFPDAVWASGGDGGHVVFPERVGASLAAIDHVNRLAAWSAGAGVRLRLTAHAGDVSQLAGADGRVQVVGNGINVAGWLLSRGGPDGVVASDAFRRWIEREADWLEVRFHEPRTLRDKSGTDQQLWLMSVGAIRSRWYAPTEGDREQLRAVTGPKRPESGWDVIYYARRILQVNKSDREALTALDRLNQLDLLYTTHDGNVLVNPFFEFLEPTMRREVVQSAQLVERQYNDVICREGDGGDTMFVILRGRVGVYKHSAAATSRSIEPNFSHQEGDVVGELAFALGRHRTADLVAMTPVVLLSFHYRDIERQLVELRRRNDRAADRARTTIASFIDRRILEYVSQDVPFLLGPEGNGPLAEPAGSDADPLAELSDHCELITLPDSLRQVTFADAVAAGSTGSTDRRDGVYLLAAGTLVNQVGEAEKLSHENFPVLWVNLPGILVLPKPRFDVVSNSVAVFRIEASGINKLERHKREALRRAVLDAAAGPCFSYDVFISYTTNDAAEAGIWAAALRSRGLSVFMNQPSSGAGFAREVNDALKHSRALVPIISSNVQIRGRAETNWVVREIKARRTYFEANPCIFPVVLGAARPELIAPGVTPIKVGADRDAAIEELVTALAAVRDGRAEPPYGEVEVADVKLE
ncbi:cyclic nucleotide-binding domain-containing protein [Solwaraspora sp. WMMD1047]|uniref:cyclic nucleotide-binding domain-containing protein n=1 Tax=Solwaraspora sp. WMMD1047 TaxID=3016102 RepID=UPI002417BD41|nr:cyclic nucleotide-binding domain-containing protein [Solwaraspora sp. WMMD1047]MDG4832472.1 cyclic nucleotide-binding domain-containing protein [Solwaraspora sp. WMMD1047]